MRAIMANIRLTRPALRLILAAVVLAWTQGALPPAPHVDTPFEEVVAHRLTGSTQVPVAGWLTLPFSTTAQVGSSVRLATGSAYLTS